MVLDTSKENVCVNKIVGQKTELVMLEGDAIVPDIKPDILSTISTSGNICVYKKEILEEKVRIDGSINVCIMYLSDTEESTVRGLTTSVDFTQIIDLDKCKPGMDLNVNVNLKGVECRVLNGRKVSVKASVEFNLKVYSNENVDIVKEINGVNNVQILNKTFLLNSLVGTGFTKAYGKDTLIIDNIDNLAEILKTDMRIVNKDIKISYNKVLAKADANVKIMYLTEDNRINAVEGLIPIMGFIDIPNVEEENLCDMQYKLRNLLIKPNEVEEHSIYVEAEVELICHVYARKEINVIQDLYSPENEMNFTQKKIQTMMGMQKIKDVCNIREKVNMPEISGNKMYNVDVVPIINNKSIIDGRVTYEGEINLNFMFSSSNGVGIDTKLINLPFDFTTNIDGINTNSNIDTDIEIKEQNFIIMPDGTIDTKIDLEFSINVSKSAEINIIDEINLEEARQQNVYSIIIYFVKPGDTLWNIAKRFRSTVDDIVRINEIEDENKIYVGQQLFIPRYVATRKQETA